MRTTRKASPGSEIGSGGSPSTNGSVAGFWYPTRYPGGGAVPGPSDRSVNVTRSRHPSAPAAASVSDAGAVAPTESSAVIDPANVAHGSTAAGAAVLGAAVLDAVPEVVLDAASSAPPPWHA